MRPPSCEHTTPAMATLQQQKHQLLSTSSHSNCHSNTTPIASTTKTRKRSTPISRTCLLVLALTLGTNFAALTGAVSVGVRKGHSATTVLDSVHFVGGQTDLTTPATTTTVLSLKNLAISSQPIADPVFNHQAALVDAKRLAVLFGQSATVVANDALDWMDPTNGGMVAASAPGATASVPAGRVGHSSVFLANNNALYSLGGRAIGASNTTYTPSTDTAKYDTAALTWAMTTAPSGAQRYGHASVAITTETILTCFGISANASATDCQVYNSLTNTFTDLTLTGDAIAGGSGRVGHSLSYAVSWNTFKVVMFGGANKAGTIAYNDVYTLDFSTLPRIIVKLVANSTAIPTDPTIPKPRAHHAAALVSLHQNILLVHGGTSLSAGGVGSGALMDDAAYFFNVVNGVWMSDADFMAAYVSAITLSVGVIIAAILGGVSVLGGFVAWYIWRGIQNDKKEALQNGDMFDHIGNNHRHSSNLGGNNTERKNNRVYGNNMDQTEQLSADEHSLAAGPFKSTTSLLQSENGGAKPKRKSGKPWMPDPYSPGGTTLADNGSMNGYFAGTRTVNANGSVKDHPRSSEGTSASSARGAFSSGEIQLGMAAHRSDSVNSSNTGGTGSKHNSHSLHNNGANGQNGTPYYNPKDLFPEDDDDSSITVSLAASDSINNMSSPWNGPIRSSNDLQPPNPRFSKGAISLAHRQLVSGNGRVGYSGSNSGSETRSPGGSISSRDESDVPHRRSVNSMQWVSYEPLDIVARPESIVYDPVSNSRSNLTVRNASMLYSNSIQVRHQSTLYEGQNGIDEQEDEYDEEYESGYSRPMGLHTVTNRDSIASSTRNSHSEYPSTSIDDSTRRTPPEHLVTRELTATTTKLQKPTMARVVNNRGSRVVLAGAGPLGNNNSSSNTSGSDDSLTSPSPMFYSTNNSNGGGKRTSSILNPSHVNNAVNGNTGNKPSMSMAPRRGPGPEFFEDRTNVVLKMPPPRRPSGLRDSTIES